MKKNKKILLILGIATLLLVGLLLLLIFIPKGESEDTATIDEGINMSISTDENGVHQVHINRNANGEIDNNSYGTLMEYVPADISQIHLENQKGTLDILSETPTDEDGNTETTVYTIKGYEDYDLQSGVPDEIANTAATITFEKIVASSKDAAAEFGLDNPRSTVTVTYTDKTKAIIYVGDDSPNGEETYIKFGDGDEIFLVTSDAVSPFDFGLTDMMSLTINSSASDTANSQASSITLSGSAFSDEIVLEPNTTDKTSASYIITKPISGYANESESSKVDGAIRGLYAESVKMVNPSEKQLSELGLSSPYAEVKAVYPDTTVDVLASKPDNEGKVNVMLSGGNIVYVMASANLPWVLTSYENLVSEYVLYPKMTSLSKISVTTGGKTYDFELNTEDKTTTDDSGSETTATTTTIKFGDNEIASENFSGFYDSISLIELANTDKGSKSGSPELTISYTYSSDNSTDTVSFYSTTDSRYLVELNGNIIGQAHKTPVTKAESELANVIN